MTPAAMTSPPQLQPFADLHVRRTEVRSCRHHLTLERAHAFKIAAVQSIASSQALIGSECFHVEAESTHQRTATATENCLLLCKLL